MLIVPMKKTAKKKSLVAYFAKNLNIVIGVVLIWRGVWHILDYADILFFSGNRAWTAFGGIVIGLIMLYAPDHDLKELEKI